MEPVSPFISLVNPFPSIFITITSFFCNALDLHECACLQLVTIIKNSHLDSL